MPNTEISEVLLTWQTLASHPHKRSARWYLSGIVAVLAFAVYGLLEDSWQTALLALGIGAMYFLIRNTPPRTISISLTRLGINVDNAFTPWSNLKNFWIVATPSFSELHFARESRLQSEISVFIRSPDAHDALDPATVRETLAAFLPERAGMEERFLDFLSRSLKL